MANKHHDSEDHQGLVSIAGVNKTADTEHQNKTLASKHSHESEDHQGLASVVGVNHTADSEHHNRTLAMANKHDSEEDFHV